MELQKRINRFVRRSNWILYALASLAGLAIARFDVALGIVCGGLIATLNFHLLSATLKKAFTPPRIASPAAVLSRYFIRFGVSGCIICLLVAGRHVHPIGLVIGLSVVVASILLATLSEATKLIFKEAV